MARAGWPDSSAYVPRGDRPVFVPFIITLTLFALTAYITLSPPSLRPLRRAYNKLVRGLYSLYGLLPALPAPLRFLSLDAPDELATAINSFSAYSTAQNAVLNGKHKAYYSQQTARQRKLAARLRWLEQLERVEDCVEENALVTGELAALGMEKARELGVPVGLRGRWAGASGRKDGRVVEVLKHFVRDWSEVGKPERDALFPPILDALSAEFGMSPREKRARGLRVLVPGAGLARLAYEIARLGFAVDANDYSHFMSIGSSLIFDRTVTPNQHTIHPYIHLFSHQRSIDNLTRPVSFPDVVPRLRKPRKGKQPETGTALRDAAQVAEDAGAGSNGTGTGKRKVAAAEGPSWRVAGAHEDENDGEAVEINFVHGDFTVELPGRSTHDAVVTLFFLDTSSNLLSYIEQIYHSLKPGAVWINSGPLLYYGSPAMELPLELVLELAQTVGFELERRMTVPAAGYTADELGMYRFLYDAEGWIMRKPKSKVLVIKDP